MKIKYNFIFWGVVLTTVVLVILEYLRDMKNHTFGIYKDFYVLYIICGTFLWYSISFLKLNKPIVFSILALAVISQKIWIYEIIKRDWTGLIWLRYFHIAFVIIYLLFIIWLSFMEYYAKNKIKTAIVHLLFYSLIFVIFIKYTTDNFFWGLHGGGYVLQFLILLFRRLGILETVADDTWRYICLAIVIFLELLVILIINIGIIFIERKKFSKKIIGIILLPIISIPIYAAMLTENFSPYSFGLLDWEHWLKTGYIIFSVILYECTYIVYVKTKMEDNGA